MSKGAYICQAFPFDPNPDWSRFYASGAEIQDYILRMTRKWDLDRDVKLNHWVREARWLEDLGQWKLTVETNGQRFEHYADILLSGQGVLV
jgi:cation diffusion facilitator CzcD-associated flavoprotein CzcO